MKKLINNNQLISEKVLDIEKEIDNIEENNSVLAVVEDVWHDYDGLYPVDFDGHIWYRKPSNQNILEICAEVWVNNNMKGEQFFASLPVGFRPAKTEGITGFAMYDNGSTRELRLQILNVSNKGVMTIYGPPTEYIRFFIFNGIIKL